MMSVGRSQFNAVERNIFDRLLDFVALIHNSTNGKCNIVLPGDFNSLTSESLAFVSFDTNKPFAYFPNDYTAEVFCPKYS